MLFLLTLTLLSVVTVGSVVVYQRGVQRRLEEEDAEAKKALPPGVLDEDDDEEEGPVCERTLDTLRIGDVVLDGGVDWLIVGTLTFREEDEVWWLHRIDNGAAQKWLEVRDRQGLVAAYFEPATDVPTFGQLASGLTHKGRPFHLTRRGDARVTAEGDVAGRKEGLVRYATYEGPGGSYLNVDEQDGQRISLSGERIVESGLLLLPGKRSSARGRERLDDDALLRELEPREDGAEEQG